jgi:glycosyltransferase involved in cell wall biosynthesis
LIRLADRRVIETRCAPGVHTAWVGPFGVEANGIAEYSERITQGWSEHEKIVMHFNGWPKSYPLQVTRAVKRVEHLASKRAVLHMQYCPFSTGPGALAVIAQARRLHVPVVTTVHEEWAALRTHKRGVVWRLYPRFEHALLRLSDAVVVHSEGQLSRLPADDRARARVIEFGVEGCGDGCVYPEEPSVGVFGVIAPGKGIETVVRACELASRDVPGLRLHVAGALAPLRAAHAYAEYLRKLGAPLGERFALSANLTTDEFDQGYHDSSVVCFGLRHATQSTTFYRALTHARPVIVTDAGGVAEVTQRERLGAVVPVDDHGAMAREIARLVGSPALREQCQSAARSYAARRTWVGSSTRHADLYASVIARAGR